MGALGAYPVREFAAACDCPQCGRVDVFPIRSPPERDCQQSDAPPVFEEIKNWGGETAYLIQTAPAHYQTDKSTCDVVRECLVCGAQWGEK